MQLDGETLRFIFGFKLRGLRQEKRLSLKTLSEMTGLSPSYINEIEKGKKYPKGEKILLLARSLGVTYDELTSVKLKEEMSSIAQLLGNTLVRGLPFEVFGIPARTFFELMTERPQQFSALVGTVLELARNHNIRVEDFFHATLRAYLDSHGNFFPELEKQAEAFRRSLGSVDTMLTSAILQDVLESQYGYEVRRVDFEKMDPALKNLHFYVMPGRRAKIFLNPGLSEQEILFILAREAGYASLGIKERLTSSAHGQVDSYEALANNFRASYFASALLIPRDPLVAEARAFFESSKWDAARFLEWIRSYPAPGSAFFHRLSQILPESFDLDQMFFLRFGYETDKKRFSLLRELHLSGLHAPHDTKDRWHYCRRWITTTLQQELAASPDAAVRAGAQRSEFYGRGQEYLCLSLAYRKELDPTQTECVTIGLRVDGALKKRVRFWDDPTLVRKQVSDVCENCAIVDCRERAAPPVLLEERKREEQLEQALEKMRTS